MKIPAQKCMLHPDDRPWVMANIGHVLFDTGILVHGRYTKTFEDLWASMCGKKHGISLNSCTTSIETALKGLNIPKYKDIVVPVNTYGATAMACQNAGFDIQLVDIEEDLMLDIDKINWQNLGGVIFVTIGGNSPVRLWKLSELCKEHDIPLILDNAHAHGTVDATEYGDAFCYSFYATKPLGIGEGGMIVTDNEDLNEFARLYRRCGKDLKGMEWDHIMTGSKYTMTEVQAIIGIAQARRLTDYLKNRKAIAKIYNEKFDPIYCMGGNHYKYIVRGRPKLKVKDITLPSPVYSKPLHQHTFIGSWGGTFSVAERVCPDHFCLPIYNWGMTEEEIHYVMDNVEVDKD